MEDEIKRRLKKLKSIKVSPPTQMQLRGGMQERLHRQERINYGKKVDKKITKLNNRLSLIEKEKTREKDREFSDDFKSFSVSSIEPLEEFNEPTFRRIRSKRGFFNE